MAEPSITQNPAAAYVYAIVVDGVDRYIGKGRNDRASFHLKHGRRLLKRQDAGLRVRMSLFYENLVAALRDGGRVEVAIMSSDLSDDEAYALEVDEIARRPIGQLWNVLSGGAGGDREFFRKHWAKPEAREHQSKLQKANWGKPGYREHQKAVMLVSCGTPEFRARRSQEMKARYERPEYREASAAITRKRWERDGAAWAAAIKRGRAERAFDHGTDTRNRWQEPDYRAKLCAAQKARWASSEARAASSARMKERCNDDEFRAKQAETMRRKWADPEYRRRILESRKVQ